MSSDTPSSPLEVATAEAGPMATNAFKLLANETRLAILLALWEAYDPFAETNAVPFSELRERVGVRDSGQFNYHLGKLEGRFVRRTDAVSESNVSEARGTSSRGGYELRRTGRILVQSIIAGTGIEEPTLEPTEVDASCPTCGAPTAISYANNYVYQACTRCQGGSDTDDGSPHGTLVAWTFEPTGLSDRTAEEVFATSTLKNFGRIALRFESICPTCSGPVEWSLDVCENHESTPDEECPNCGRTEAIRARETCTVCKSSGMGSPGMKVLLHPAVVAFYYDHGVEVGFTGDTDFTDVIRTLDLVAEFEEDVVSADPPRVRVTARYEGDELRLTLDEEMNVVDVTRSD